MFWNQTAPFNAKHSSSIYSWNWRETAKITASLAGQKSPGHHHFLKSLPQLLENTKAYLSVHQHVWGFIGHPVAALPVIISLCHVPQIWSAFKRCAVKGKIGFSKTSPQVSFLPRWLMDLTFYQHLIRISVYSYSKRYLHRSKDANSPFTVITLFCL